MTSDMHRCWVTLVEEFRTFGGTANNIAQRKGEFGLGLFPIDPSKPVELRVPNQLLVATDNLALINGEIVLKDDSCYPNGFGDWYRRFQAEYSWGAEAKHSIKTFEAGLSSLPNDVKKLLKNLGLPIQDNRLSESNEEQRIFNQFILTRQISKKGGLFLMPMIELINHSPEYSSWEMGEEDISINGKYQNEILVRYSPSDPLRRFFQYGFNCKEPIAFSLDVAIKHRSQTAMVKGGINFKHLKEFKTSWNGTKLLIERPTLALRDQPRLPRTLFRKSCRAVNQIDCDELFDQIHQANRLAVLQIIRKLERESSATARQLREACFDQIDALSNHYGARDERQLKINQAAT